MNTFMWNPPEIPALATGLTAGLRARIDDKTKPVGSLGRLEQLALQLGLIQQTLHPTLERGQVVVFAGDHGLAAEGVSAFPPEVTPQMVLNFLRGGAAINVFARQHGLPVLVVDVAVAADLPVHPSLLHHKVRPGTGNALRGPAMDAAELERCLSGGVALAHRLAAEGFQALLPGEMGIGNSSAAALLVSALLGLPLDLCVGAGTGKAGEALERKREILRQVRDRHAAPARPELALQAYGGCEIAMMAGAMLGAAEKRLLVVVDGFIATSAAVAAARFNPAVLDYCVFAHASAEGGHAHALRALDVKPLLDLGLRLGEGTGAVLAWPLLQSACRFLAEMATFSSAQVTAAPAGAPEVLPRQPA
jgi:nicotinate-nucleotide--dimethylbenzimidazole phosphoribosyltransferase